LHSFPTRRSSDLTGHGLAAGTVVTAMKSLWNAFSGEPDLTGVMYRTSTAFKRMRIPMLYMAVALGRLRGNRLELIGAGMPAALIYREATKRIESVPLKGLPLGSPGNPSRSEEHTSELQSRENLVCR